MEIVTVMTRRRIHIACCDAFPMHRIPVHRFMVMALNTLGNGDPFVLLPVLVNMNVGMAVGAAHPFLDMHAVVMFGVLFLVTPLARHLMNFRLAAHMFGKVGNFDMAAGAGILPVDRGSKAAD